MQEYLYDLRCGQLTYDTFCLHYTIIAVFTQFSVLVLKPRWRELNVHISQSLPFTVMIASLQSCNDPEIL